ncbi:MAG: hypothetical protein RLZ22_235 [Verrucomicrobiota bacterium]|jgi:hypothetical protein
MSTPKYSQLHRKLLFHWTGPRPVRSVKSREDRVKYLELLASMLDEGLRYSVPDSRHSEWILKDEIRATHPMLCFSEWGVSESNAHSGRYGYMGLGFTRKFVMNKGGRPVVYIPNNQTDPFRQALVEVIQAIREGRKENAKLYRHAELLASYLKSYNFNRTTEKKASKEKSSNKSVRKKRARYHDDHLLRLDFGGLFANLEDREWRIIPKRIEDEPQHLKFKSGDLAMVVFPDHQTLSLAMQCDAIMKRIILPGRPSVCMVSREVIQSV